MAPYAVDNNHQPQIFGLWLFGEEMKSFLHPFFIVMHSAYVSHAFLHSFSQVPGNNSKNFSFQIIPKPLSKKVSLMLNDPSSGQGICGYLVLLSRNFLYLIKIMAYSQLV